MQQPPQGQPNQPQPKRSRRRLWITLSVIAGVLVLSCITCSVIGALNPAPKTAAIITPTTEPTQPISQASTPTTPPTTLPASKPTLPTTTIPKPTQQATSGQAILGSDIGPFIAKFGQPTQMGTGAYDFQNHTVEVVVNNHHSFSILDDAPNDGAWSSAEAKASCLSLSPSDARYTRHIAIQSPNAAEEYVYVSPSLAKELPASDFTDENLNQTQPGTFGIVLNYVSGSTSQFYSCATQVGLQGN